MSIAAAMFPANLAPGPDSTYLYYTVAANSPAGAVVRINLTDTTVTNGLTSRNAPLGIAVDATGVYWTEKGGGAVAKAPLDLSGATNLATGQIQPYSIALDNQFVFWTNEGGNTIFRIVKSPGSSDLPSQVAVNLNQPHGIVVSNDLIYWANYGEGAVWSASLAGNNPIRIGSFNMPEALAAYDGHVYATTASTVSRVIAPSMDIATGQNGPVNLAIDPVSRFVYWTSRGTAAQSFADGSIMKAPLSGGPPVVLARRRTDSSLEAWTVNPYGIAVDGRFVYWTTNVMNGSVWRLPK